MSPRLRATIVGLAALTQIAGAAGFVLAPEAVFADIATDALARFCLRLAGYAHASFAVLTLALVARGEGIRWIAGASVVYHLLAGIEGAWTPAGVVLADPQHGPAVFHAVMVVVLGVAAAAPDAMGTARQE